MRCPNLSGCYLEGIHITARKSGQFQNHLKPGELPVGGVTGAERVASQEHPEIASQLQLEAAELKTHPGLQSRCGESKEDLQVIHESGD